MLVLRRLFFVTLIWWLLPIGLVEAQTARQRDEEQARVLNNQAAVLHNSHHYREAVTLYNKVLSLNPRAAVFYNNRAAALDQIGELAAALSDYDTALRLDPSPAAFYSNRAALLLKRNDVPHAIADYDIAVGREPQTGFFWQERAKARLRAGDKKAALDDFRTAYQLDPKLAFSKQKSDDLAETPAPTPAPSEPAPPEATPSTPSGPITGRRIALIIGNSDYYFGTKLHNPHLDAERISAALRKAGFTSVQTVLDGTKAQMSDALDRFESEAAQSDWAVIYYSGHGVEAAGVNYLVPVDLRLRSDLDLQEKAIPLERVLSTLQRAATLRLVILDACRVDPFKNQMTRSIRTHVVTRGLAPAPKNLAPSGLLVAYAAKGGETAADGPAGTNSPYAFALANRIEQHHVELGLLFRQVRDDVLVATDRQQEPFVYGSLPSDELFIHP